MSMVKSTKRLTNFDEVSKEINKLIDAVNTAQQSVGYGATGKIGDIRITGDDDNKIYFEALTDKGWYTTFTDVMVPKPVKGRPHPKFSKLEVDEFYAKNIYAQSLRSTNGGVIVSDSAIIDYTIHDGFYVKIDSNVLLNPFVVGDLLYCVSMSADKNIIYKELRVVVTAVNENKVEYTLSAETGTNIPVQVGTLEAGDTLVRIGNNNLSLNPERGSVIIITTFDERDMGLGVKNYAPYVKVLTAIDSYDDYFNGVPSVMLGNLGTVEDTSFPVNSFLTPSTGAIGLYTANGFFKGKIYLADEDLLGDIAIGKTYKSATDPSLTNVIKEGDLWIDTSPTNRFRTQVWTGNPSDDVSPGSWTSYLPGVWDAPVGDGLLITSQYMGYFSGGSFKTYFRDNGYFKFAGDASNYIEWDGATLAVKGEITVTNPEDFKNPPSLTYIQATDPMGNPPVMKQGYMWYDTTNSKWKIWQGADSNYAIPGGWIEQLWGTKLTGTGIYTGKVTAGQITTGTLNAATITLGTATTDGIIQSYDYVANTSGWKIAKGIAEFNNGNINFNTGGYTLEINSPSIDFTDTTFGTSSYIEHRITSGNKADLYLNASTGGRITLSASEIFLSGNIGTWGGAIVDSPTSGYFRFNGIKFVWDTPTLSESDPIYTSSSWYTTSNNSADWNEAHSWGNHASAGYLTSNQTITLSGGVSGSGTTSIVVTVADNSHSHTGATISGLTVSDFSNANISQWTNDSGYLTTAIGAINGSTASSQSLAGGNGISITDAGATHTFAVKASNGLGFSGGDLVIDYSGGQSASATTKGFLTSTDWNTFNGKSTVSISATDSLVGTIGLSEGTLNIYGRTLTINGTGYTVLTDLELV